MLVYSSPCTVICLCFIFANMPKNSSTSCLFLLEGLDSTRQLPQRQGNENMGTPRLALSFRHIMLLLKLPIVPKVTRSFCLWTVLVLKWEGARAGKRVGGNA